jgi:pimeloyl-ACP methyl ester carboxylesterase
MIETPIRPAARLRRYRQLARVALAASLIAAAVVLPGSSAVASGPEPTAAQPVAAGRPSAPKPTVVLVHGAFADASGWNDVTENLQRQGYPVYAPANPLRGLGSDADYIRAFLGTIGGPIVLVGHSYGGAVITNAATGNPNIKALVYIAAYALDIGESVGAANELGSGTTTVGNHLVIRPFPGSGTQDGDAYIDPAFFPSLFAQDLPDRQAKVMAASQRPAALSTLGTPSGEPAWKSIPSWYLVARNDNIIPPQAERAMAARAHAHTIEIRSSHVPMMSHPREVTDLITAAARNAS